MKTSVVVSAICGLLAGILPAWAQSDMITRMTRVGVMRPGSNTPAPPPTDAYCRANFGFPCYSPQEIQAAYGVAPVLSKGFQGTGQTIVIVVSYGSPTIAADLKVFDAGYGLPDPPSFTVLAPFGTVPFNPNNQAQVNWAAETTLDVMWAHAMAPGAKIVVLTSPVDETQGTQGLRLFLQLEQYALEQHLGQIISQSWGTAENTLFTPEGRVLLQQFEALYQRAAQQQVTVLAAAGDTGTSNVDVNNNPYPFPTVVYPACSPWVTAVGGTTLNADTNGNYQSETVWNNSTGATGGGVSQQFAEPLYQASLPAAAQTILGGHRGMPDLALNADFNTPILIYVGFFPNADQNGYYAVGGTSAAAPQWGGIIADVNQLAGFPLGFLNPRLYSLGENGGLFHDISVGNNAFNGLPGYTAAPGWDPTSGWGTPNVSTLAAALAH